MLSMVILQDVQYVLHWALLYQCAVYSNISVHMYLQKFRFCGDLDCPDWVLAEISILSKIVSNIFTIACVYAYPGVCHLLLISSWIIISVSHFECMNSNSHNMNCNMKLNFLQF